MKNAYPSGKKAGIWILVFMWTFVSILTFALVTEAFTRSFRPDELQHLHLARAIAHGMVPYIDFFEHHLPLHYAFLIPLYYHFGDSIHYFLSARCLFLGLVLLNGFLIWRLIRPRMSVLWQPVVLLTYGMSSVTFEKGLEIRPDNIMVTIVLASVFLLCGNSVHWNEWSRMGAGMLLGAALFTSVKAVFPVSVICLITMIIHRRRLKELMILTMGLVLVIIAGLTITARYGFLYAMIQSNYLENGRWIYRFSWRVMADSLLMDDSILIVIWGIGIGRIIWDWTRRCEHQKTSVACCRSDGGELACVPPMLVFTCLFICMVIFIVWVIPNPYLHNYLIIALTGAVLGIDGLSRWSVLTKGRIMVWAPLGVAMLVFVSGMDHFPASPVIRWKDQMDVIFKVHRLAGPNGTVLDDWTGRGALCQPASFFPFLHIEIIRQYRPRIQEELVRVLNQAPPKVIVARSVTLEGFFKIQESVNSQYEYLPDDGIWVYMGSPGMNADLRRRPPQKLGNVTIVLAQN
ncbi:hypothetical protein JXA80_08535 [bacterium]|nr:hypothetical protein [candidate division CSSED10-310 bacterium]